uniref:Uncharacterized protein LOC111101582 n=1 Tax=Crassostrea virginica TaxID=6565 RepID=A0A8B8AF69_CRAVI|nr:uncharacterized protein LOC111101582 [Crassostrea virginica]
MMFFTVYRTVCLKVAFSVWFIQNSGKSAASPICERDYNGGCCDGYYFNATKAACAKCMPGYIGPNCTLSCLYPTYGEECQGNCNCSNSSCDISTGCRAPIIDGDTCQGHSNCSNTECTASTECTTLSTVTIEHKASERNVTLYSISVPDATKSTINGILIILIRIFGGVDILLICAHSVLFGIDHQRKRSSQMKKTIGRRFVTRSNSMYENIEIGLSNV